MFSRKKLNNQKASTHLLYCHRYSSGPLHLHVVPVIKDCCWLPALCRTTHGVFSRPPQQQVSLPTCYCLWTSSENGREVWRGIYWRAAWPSCPSRVRGDSTDLLGTRESHSRPWQRELCIQQVKSRDSAGGAQGSFHKGWLVSSYSHLEVATSP